MVRVSLRPNEVLFKTERAMIYSRLVEGRYPPYREVFPEEADESRCRWWSGRFMPRCGRRPS